MEINHFATMGSALVDPHPMPGRHGHLANTTRFERVLVWLRRDLRVADNPALTAALQIAKQVIPVYIYAPEEEGQFQAGRCSRWWLFNTLQAFEKDLQALGSRLIYLRCPESRQALLSAISTFNIQAVLFNHLYDPISMVRDNEVKAELNNAGILCQSFNADVLREPWEVLTPNSNNKPYTCFEDFWTAHCALPYPPPPPLPIPAALPPVPPAITGIALTDLGLMAPEEELSNQQLEYHWQPGSADGHKVLQEFLTTRLSNFDNDKAKTDRDSTSRLSPYIHFGELSVRHIFHSAKALELEWARTGSHPGAVKAFLRQIAFREYSRYLSFHFPFTHERSLLEHLRAVPWRFDQGLFKAWRQGTTGYPLVDAGMRELWSTGWTHNRVRVICASFLVKNLLLPWQWGLKHYWDALLDADLECDALGWQYVAGCLTDAHEFGYLIDHVSESKKYDPKGNYIRRWLPALARLPTAYIHRPWDAPSSILEDAGIELGGNYPLPVIDWEESKAALKAATEVIDRAAAKSASINNGNNNNNNSGGGGDKNNPSTARGPFRPATDPSPMIADDAPWPEPYKSTARRGGTGGLGSVVSAHSPNADSHHHSHRRNYHQEQQQHARSSREHSEGVESNAIGGSFMVDHHHHHHHHHHHNQQQQGNGYAPAATTMTTTTTANGGANGSASAVAASHHHHEHLNKKNALGSLVQLSNAVGGGDEGGTQEMMVAMTQQELIDRQEEQQLQLYNHQQQEIIARQEQHNHAEGQMLQQELMNGTVTVTAAGKGAGGSGNGGTGGTGRASSTVAVLATQQESDYNANRNKGTQLISGGVVDRPVSGNNNNNCMAAAADALPAIADGEESPTSPTYHHHQQQGHESNKRQRLKSSSPSPPVN